MSTANATNDTKFRLMTLVGLAKPVKVIEITDLHFGKPTDPPALLFRYRTDLPVTPAGRDAVHKEALRIWGVFQKMTEQAHYPVAVITACDAPKAGSTHSQHPMTFAWALHNGIWQEIA